MTPDLDQAPQLERDSQADGSGMRTPGRFVFRPFEPLATRLNRSALVLAAVVVGMTVLTAIVLLQPSRSAPPAETPGATMVPTPSRPTFLDRPARPFADMSDSLGNVAGPADKVVPTPLKSARGGQADGIPQVYPAEPTGPAQPSARERAYLAALVSGVVADPRRAEAVGPPHNASPETQAVATSATDSRTAFLAEARIGQPSRIVLRPESAGSPYTVRAGTVIPGVLITGVTSDLPGEVVGQVSRDVYDSRTQRVLLIPRGSKLIGKYDHRVVASQSRLLMAWTRLLLPDGRSITLPGLPFTDQQGQTGAKDRVDHHTDRVFGNALLLSLLSAGAQLSQPQQASVFAAPSPGQVAAGAVGQEFSQVATELVRRNLDGVPTITIRPGTPFNVFAHEDLVFDAPYTAGP